MIPALTYVTDGKSTFERGDPFKEAPMIKCPVCGEGVLQEQHVEKWLQGGEDWVLFRNVPSLVCDHCGDTAFSQATAERLTSIVSSETALKPTGQITSRVFDLAGIAQSPVNGQTPVSKTEPQNSRKAPTTV